MSNIKRLADKIACEEGVDPRLFRRLIQQESGWRMVRSPKGAVGFTQLMPGTAASLGVNPNDPTGNLRGGARYLRQQLDTFHGDVRKALAAYNAGPGAVEKYGGVPPFAETQGYVKNILAGYGGRDSKTPGAALEKENQPGYSFRDIQKTIPGVDNSALRQQLKLDYFSRSHDRNALLDLASGLQQAQDVPARTVTKQVRVRNAAPASAKAAGLPSGVAHFDGRPVAAWIEPALKYARKHGWKGTVTSGFRSDAEQKRIYDSGVRPAAKPKSEGGSGSNHEGTRFPLGAVDVSDAQTLARILRGSKYAHLLIYAGAKDPVHFSHPHNGGY